MIGLASDQWRISWLGEPILDCGDLIALFPENDVSRWPAGLIYPLLVASDVIARNQTYFPVLLLCIGCMGCCARFPDVTSPRSF